MRTQADIARASAMARIAVAGVIAGVVAGCSADSARYGSDPFGSPFSSQSRQPEYTGSLPPAQAAPTTAVTAQPLPQQSAPAWQQPMASPPPPPPRVPTTAAAPPPPRWPQAAAPSPTFTPQPSRPATVAAAPSPTYRGPTSARGSESTGTIPAAGGGGDSWAWDGGTAVTVQPGETVDILARRYGVPAAAIQRANNLADPRHVQPGQRLVIPAYSYRPGGQAAASRPATPAPAPSMAAAKPAVAPAPAPAPAAAGGQHTVNSGETLTSVAKRYNTTRTKLAKANGLAPDAKLQIGQKLTVPGRVAAATPPRPATPAPAKRAETTSPAKPATTVAMAPTTPAPVKPVTVAKPAAPAVAAKPDAPAPESAAMVKPSAPVADARDDSSPGAGFRWPVKGRVISNFGSKPGGEKNDGINIAVPEGASVKAAEDGVVAYAGSELRGYGNLVLIKHADGWVTAYAHNSEVTVKRGDQVKRGQIIGRAGQTGNVTSPQVHFELRRGSSPVDPLPHLSGG